MTREIKDFPVGRTAFSWGYVDVGGCYGGWGGHNRDIIINVNGKTSSPMRLSYCELMNITNLLISNCDVPIPPSSVSFDEVTIWYMGDDGNCFSTTGFKGYIEHPGTLIPKNGYYVINTQKNLKGTVEKRTGDLLWHITSPVVMDISYGPPDAIPATWIDGSGNEQMAVIKTDAWGVNDIALDHYLSGGLAEEYVSFSDVDIISQMSGYTTQLKYPKTPPPPPPPPQPPIVPPEEEVFDITMLVGVVTVIVGVLGTLYILKKK